MPRQYLGMSQKYLSAFKLKDRDYWLSTGIDAGLDAGTTTVYFLTRHDPSPFTNMPKLAYVRRVTQE